MNSFDELTKKLASGTSRRDALKIMGAAAVATLMAPLTGGASALAASPDGFVKNACIGQPQFGSCRSNCTGLGCFCDFDVKGNFLCFVNEYCYNAAPCSTNKQCGLGSACLRSDNGCGQSVCAKKCHRTTPCVPGVRPGPGTIVG